MMVKGILLACVSCFLMANVYAADYYVSASGNDSATGTSAGTAWKTLNKVNGRTFSNGDRILFKRGDVFYGQLRIKNPGVTVNAYGTGENPVISGLEQIASTWTLNSGNIWETTFPANKPASVANLFHGTEKLPISRYPNKSVNNGYLNMETHVGLTQFTDTALPATPDWTGADIVVRSERWRLNRTTVTSHTGNTIVIPPTTGIQNLRDRYGYFFVNDIKAIDLAGEWAYKSASGKLYMYSSTDPNTKTIYFPRTDTLLTIRNAANITVKNLAFKCANKLAVFVSNCPNSLLDSISVLTSGGDGVNYVNCSGGTFSNSIVDDANNTGIYASTTNSNFLFKNNTITNIGNEAFGKSKTFIGLDCNSPNSEVSNNYVAKTGYCGILSAGLNNLVKHNFVDSACLSLEDNGGIYTNYQNGANTGEIIEENYVSNSIGERLGAPEDHSMANGIYVDNLSTGVTVRNNTVAFIRGLGLYANFNKTGNQFYNNTSFSSGYNELNIHRPHSAPDYIIRDNILVTTDTASNHNVVNSDRTEIFTYEEMGSYKDNYVINPFNNKTVVVEYKANGFSKINRYTPYEWEAAAAQINGTLAAPILYPKTTPVADVIKFYINKTTSAQLISLPAGRFIDAKNQVYCGSVTLQPFRSIVLFKVDNNTCGGVVACATPANLQIDSVMGNSATLSWSAASGALNYDIRYRAEADTAWKYANNIHSTSMVLLNLAPQVYYHCELRASCYGNEGNWVVFPAFRSGNRIEEHVFVNANYANCAPATAFANVQSDTDNKWTSQSSGGLGTVNRDFMRSSSATEDCPPITMSVIGELDTCSSYDVFFYYMSPATQPWKTKARLSTDTVFKVFDRTTPGTVLIPDSLGNLDRLYRCKLGTVHNVSGFSVVIDDLNSGVSTSRSMFDGLGYLKVGESAPAPPDSLVTTAVSASTIKLRWKDNASAETAYIVERKQGTSPFTVLATLGANTSTYDDPVGTTGIFTYRVYAIGNPCKSPYSNQLTVNNNP